MRIRIRRGTAAQWAASITPLLLGEPGIDLTNRIIKIGDGSTLWTSLAPPGDNASTFGPADQGFRAWTFDPALALGTASPAAGVLTLSRLQIRDTRQITELWCAVAVAGVGLTASQNFVCLIDSTGLVVGSTADQSANWAGTGVLGAALTAPVTPTVGFYWVGILSNAATSTPTFARAGAGAVTGISSAGLAATAARFGTSGAGLTAVPASITPASIAVATNGTFWVAAR